MQKGRIRPRALKRVVAAWSRWRRQWQITAGLMLGLAFACDAAAAPPTLRFAVGETWAPPLIETRDGRPVRGLMLELMEAIARQVGARPVYVMLPAKRVDAALEAGEVDLHCLISPKWYDSPPPPERLGPPMVMLEDVLAVRDAGGDGRPLDLMAQKGLRLGTVLGYRYEELTPHFEAGRLRREDAPNQQAMLDKLLRGRTPVAVVERLVLTRFNHQHPADEQLRVLQSVSQTQTHCLLGARPGLPRERLLEALKAVVGSGEFQRLMKRYR
jgi:polar amino acid transport system substrate-binding protein